MKQSAKIRCVAFIGFGLSTLAPAQTPQSVPATQQSELHRAEVTYADGKLFVSANNSSLNQILRDIARKTGMKITGGVPDERVFGQYGPAIPSKILGTLLNGTGNNMLLLEATGAAPAELILTPRSGGSTPPNPSAAAVEEDPDSQQARPPYSPEENTPATPATSEPRQSPNAVKTPQQIYEQLQRMRQQRQQPSSPQ